MSKRISFFLILILIMSTFVLLNSHAIKASEEAPLAPPATTLPFTDTFITLDAWTVVDGVWTLISGGVQGSSSTEALMYAGSKLWTNYQITALATISAGGEASVVFRFVDSNNYYWAGIGCWGHQYSIGKIVGGVSSEINGSGIAPSNSAGIYNLHVIAQDNVITLYVNDVVVLCTTDSAFASGAIGLRTFASTMQVQNIIVSTSTDSLAVRWMKTYPTLNQTSYQVVQTSDGGYVIAGEGSLGQMFTYAWGVLIRTDSVGNLIWNKTYSSGFFGVIVTSLVQTSDGGYAFVIVGNMMPASRFMGDLLIKTNSAGDEMWRVTSSGYPPLPMSIYSVLQTSDGEIAWGGNYQTSQTFGVFLNKTDLSGNQIWGKIYPGVSASRIIRTTDDGFAFVSGSEFVKTDSAGNLDWIKMYGNTGSANLLQTSDGGFAFQGNGLLYKADALGNIQWTQTITGDLQAQTNDGGYLFIQSNSLFRTDSSGILQWSQVFGAALSSLTKTVDQEYVVAGTYPSVGAGNSTVWLAKISLLTIDDWPMFHHDASRIGYSTSNGPTTNQVLWSYATGGAVTSSPAVANGVVYVGSSDGNVYAFDAATGFKLWSYATGGAVISSPAVVAGVVYVGSNDGNVYALNAGTGNKIWTYNAGGVVSSSPAVANGVVYVGAGGNMTALSASTGNLLWNFTGNAFLGFSPAVANNVAYIVLWNSWMIFYGLNCSTGSQTWSFAIGYHGGGTTAVANGVMYGELSGGYLSAWNTSTHNSLWIHPIGNWGGPCPAVANGVVYAGSDSTVRNVYAVSASTGGEIWSFATGNIVSSAPAVNDGVVYVGSNDDKVYAINAATGSQIWSYTTGAAVESSPSIYEGKVYVGSNDGKLYCFGSSLGSNLALQGAAGWYWTGNTAIKSVAKGDVDADGKVEIVTGGYYFDGSRDVAQLSLWSGTTLALKSVKVWYWIGDTVISSVAVGDVDGDGKMEIVTGGSYNDGSRDVAQLCIWDGVTLALKSVKVWYWTGDTVISSVAVGDVDADCKTEIVTGGFYNDVSRNVAQLCVWSGATLALKNIRTWFWTGDTYIISVSVGDVDADGKVEVATGGYYNDGARDDAQICIWNGATMALKTVKTWYWTSDTVIYSIAVGDVDSDGKVEIVTGGGYFDGTRVVAQLGVWNGATLALKNIQTWYWTSSTIINSVGVADVDGDGKVEVVSGGYYYDGFQDVAQLCVWSGATLGFKNVQTWFWTGNTVINSVAAGDVDNDAQIEIVTGGYYHDGARDVAQLCVWR